MYVLYVCTYIFTYQTRQGLVQGQLPLHQLLRPLTILPRLLPLHPVKTAAVAVVGPLGAGQPVLLQHPSKVSMLHTVRMCTVRMCPR